MEQMLRNFFLFLSKNKFLTRLAKKYGLRFGASRFVAGETIEGTIGTINNLNKSGLAVTIDYLGEFIDNEQEANRRADNTIEAIEIIGREKARFTSVIKNDLNGFRHFYRSGLGKYAENP